LSSTDAGLSERLPPRAVLAALALALVAATIVALLLQPSQREIERALDGGGAAGPAIFAGTYALLTVAFFPGAVLTLAAGALYGVAGGTAVSMVGATLGALGAFLIARRSAHSAVERAGGERYGALVDRLRGRGLFALLALRLLPVVPFNALNYAAGASSIGLRDYTLATVLGIAPGAFAYAALGAGIDDPASPLFIGAAVIAIGLAIAARAVSKRTGEPAEKRVDPQPPAAAASADPRRRLAWSLAFFVVVVGAFAALTLLGLFH